MLACGDVATSGATGGRLWGLPGPGLFLAWLSHPPLVSRRGSWLVSRPTVVSGGGERAPETGTSVRGQGTVQTREWCSGSGWTGVRPLREGRGPKEPAWGGESVSAEAAGWGARGGRATELHIGARLWEEEGPGSPWAAVGGTKITMPPGAQWAGGGLPWTVGVCSALCDGKCWGQHWLELVLLGSPRGPPGRRLAWLLGWWAQQAARFWCKPGGGV